MNPTENTTAISTAMVVKMNMKKPILEAWSVLGGVGGGSEDGEEAIQVLLLTACQGDVISSRRSATSGATR